MKTIILLGAVGTGKATIVNKIVGYEVANTHDEQLNNSREAKIRKIEPTDTDYRFILVDTSGANITRSYEQNLKGFFKSFKDEIHDGVCLIIFVVNKFYLEEYYLECLLNCYENNFSSDSHKICALVHTHCDFLTENDIKTNLKRNNVIKRLVSISQKGVIGVTFANLEGIEPATISYLQGRIVESEAKLKSILENCNEVVSFADLVAKPGSSRFITLLRRCSGYLCGAVVAVTVIVGITIFFIVL